jgi:outer membrane receptor protein involved in Fe transport
MLLAMAGVAFAQQRPPAKPAQPAAKPAPKSPFTPPAFKITIATEGAYPPFNYRDRKGIPAGFVNTPARTASTGFFSSGNPFLTEETSDSYTVGFVLTPRFMPGFSLTVDYYHITVDNLIAVLGAQVILNQCYDLPTLSNQFCQLLNPRNPDFTFANPALISAGVNFAKQEANGIDIEANYRHTFSNGHRLSLHGILTYVTRRSNFISPTDPTFEDRQLSELGDPQISANFTAQYGFGPLDIRYSANYIGRQTIGTYETYFSVQGRPPANPDSTREVYYPVQVIQNIRLQYRVNERFQFYGGVDNFSVVLLCVDQ